MRKRKFECGFCSHSFGHITSEKSFSAHSPTAKFSLGRLIQHRCLHHWSSALLVAAAPQSQHREEKSGEAWWRCLRCLAFVSILQRCPCVFLFSFSQAPTLQKVEAALLQEALRTNGSAARRHRKLVFCVRNTMSPMFCFLDTFPKGEPMAMLDIDHAALEIDGFFSAPVLAFPVSAPSAEMFQSQTVTSAHFQL